ncbi:hypothetical protein JHL21_03240 [Devosia sp. WQ 349]|uniref:hypothetical protein n=1 Tax=Devosia sp. WQ 349K1 TaxID=2800329 RepID=UPI001905FE75|nr:hypothetical protein [Devosia sp. WQ 349K1]MBK1793509.1 hypothetical protein [Devosia sp. WQ 349K1]
MRAIGLSLLMFSLATPVLAGSPSWSFSRSYSDQTCIAELKTGSMHVGIIANIDGSYSGFMRSPTLPHTTAVTWQVKGQPRQKTEGYFDRANRAVILPGLNPRLLTELARGNHFDLYVHGTGARQNALAIGTTNLSLKGSGRAIAQLASCATWNTYGVPTTVLYSGSVSRQ